MAAYLTGIPHPILLVQGEQGTAKSNLIRTLLALVDPQPAADRTPPRDSREWAIFARASWAFSFDNITDIPPWLSNALCKGVTGDAVLQRVLHSDEDIGVYSFQRVIALTTIAIRHDVAGDLADRILLVEPEVIEIRRTEADITAARAAALPAALGAILDLVAGVLRELPATTVDNAPRMADFAKVLAALDTVTGWDTLASYRAKVASLALSLIEGNTFAYAIYRLATCPSPGGLDPRPWEGTAAELLDTLRRICADARMPASDLPEDVRAVGRQVREIAPSLRKAGIDIRTRKSGSRRLLRITKIDDEPAPEDPGDSSSLETRKRHVPHVPSPHHRRSAAPERGTSSCAADVPHVPPAARHSRPSCPTWDMAMSYHPRSSEARWDMWDMTRPVSHLAVTSHRGHPARGAGDAYTRPAQPRQRCTGAPPGASSARRLATGRHPPPPRDTFGGPHSHHQRPGPARARAGRARLAHPAAVASQQTAPRQLPRLPCRARHPWASRPRLPLPDGWRLVPRRPRRHHRPRPHHRLVAAASPLRCPASPQAPPAGSGRHRRPRRPAAASPGHRPAARYRPGRRTHPAQRCGTTPPDSGDGRDTLTLLARLRGGPRPWPADSEHQPVTVATPSGRRPPVVPGTRRRAPPGPQRPPRPLRAGLASRPQSRLVLRHRPRRGRHRRYLPAPRRRPHPAWPHARLARPRGHPRHHCGTAQASHLATTAPARRVRPGRLPGHRH